ncbi:hypothetical protein [Listeria rocourtiae]|uniref:hypothetical protein n=1 Tax=Listeria rocourtiae TaxID=647910 RepID=UPI0003E8B0DD|nr:hypothetical protein [Listeria rocourtiae]EUJ42256.1 hypothetical protein PROCOU_17575 [Listeria rocourtiae FSL F6-920]
MSTVRLYAAGDADVASTTPVVAGPFLPFASTGRTSNVSPTFKPKPWAYSLKSPFVGVDTFFTNAVDV